MTPEHLEAAKEFCPDELDHAYHTDKYPCVKIAQFLATYTAAKDAQIAELRKDNREWQDASDKFRNIGAGMEKRAEQAEALVAELRKEIGVTSERQILSDKVKMYFDLANSWQSRAEQAEAKIAALESKS